MRISDWSSDVCSSDLVLLRHAEDPQPLIAEGSWHGRILHARRGDGGFGYDPVFLDPERGRSAAELDPALKNRISHRGPALATLREKLPLLYEQPQPRALAPPPATARGSRDAREIDG